MAPPTDAEREAFLWMQGRMVELLQRHDVARFEHTFTERTGDPETTSAGSAGALFRRQRDLAVFFYLRGELFDHILPRIKRRLSFVAPHTLRREELPPRGRIDWPRTAAGALRDRPGEPPLTVYTRRRRRHFDTPENLLTVITLLEYREAAQALLDTETAATSTPLIRHPLHDIVEGCTRELVFPQFAGLIPECQGIRDGQGRLSVEELEETMAANLLPGRNSAYDDLLEWRHRLRRLRLLDRTTDQLLQPMISPDPKRDNYLYQLWLFYELGDLLQQQGKLRAWDDKPMALWFVWGEGSDEHKYRLQHDQQIPGIPRYWLGAPGARPDFYIMRTDRQRVVDGDQVIWHEPGYVLDAKYYRPDDSETAPASPIKRMIADLQLTGERYGALLFAFHGDPSAAGPETERGLVRPNPQTVQRSAPDV
jgi:hypothetical protein